MAGRKGYYYRSWRYRNNRRRYYRNFYYYFKKYNRKLANRMRPNFLDTKIQFQKVVQMGANYTYYFTDTDVLGSNPVSTLWVSELVENDEVYKMYNNIYDLVRVKSVSLNFNPGVTNLQTQTAVPFQVRFIFNEDKFDANTTQTVIPFGNHLNKYYKIFTSKYLPSGQTDNDRTNGDGLPGRLSVADTNAGNNRSLVMMPKWNMTLTVYLRFKKNALYN